MYETNLYETNLYETNSRRTTIPVRVREYDGKITDAYVLRSDLIEEKNRGFGNPYELSDAVYFWSFNPDLVVNMNTTSLYANAMKHAIEMY